MKYAFYDANDRLTTDIYDNNGNTTSSGGTSNTYNFVSSTSLTPANP